MYTSLRAPITVCIKLIVDRKGRREVLGEVVVVRVGEQQPVGIRKSGVNL